MRRRVGTLPWSQQSALVHDHPSLLWQGFPSMTSDRQGSWRLPPPNGAMSLTFSMITTR